MHKYLYYFLGNIFILLLIVSVQKICGERYHLETKVKDKFNLIKTKTSETTNGNEFTILNN